MNKEEKVQEVLSRRPSLEKTVEAAKVKKLLNIQLSQSQKTIKEEVDLVFQLLFGAAEHMSLEEKARIINESKAQVDLIKAQLDLVLAGAEDHL